MSKKKINKDIQHELQREILYHMGCVDGVGKVSEEGYADQECTFAHGIQVGLTMASVIVANILCPDKTIDDPCRFKDAKVSEFPCRECMEKDCDK